MHAASYFLLFSVKNNVFIRGMIVANFKAFAYT